LIRDTLRLYEKRGLLRARRGANGYRDYPPEAGDWLRCLRAALARKLLDIDARIAGLTQLRAELARRLAPQAAACPLQGEADAAQLDLA
jgi:MerR family copper efflux transcriptional regulator